MKILLTGTTGSLGSYMLKQMIQNNKNNIKKIYVPIRSKANKNIQHTITFGDIG